MDPTPGALVTPQLRLERQLGEGGMGTIWAGEHLGFGRRVAVKFMSTEMLQSTPDARDRFLREATILYGMKHRNVVELVETGQTGDGTPYIVLELMEGEPLLDYLVREGAFETPETLQLVDQLAAGLEYLHGHGLVHRDIKAENIFIKSDGGRLSIKLFDFGLAKNPAEEKAVNAKPLTAMGTMVGTIEYMSPEQMLSSKDADHNADLWALAVTAYVTLVGKLPYDAPGLAQTFARIRNQDFERPSATRDDVGPAVDAWFMRAFNPELSSRFKSAGEMAQTLRQAMAAPRHPPQAPAPEQQTAPQQPGLPLASLQQPAAPAPAAATPSPGPDAGNLRGPSLSVGLLAGIWVGVLVLAVVLVVLLSR